VDRNSRRVQLASRAGETNNQGGIKPAGPKHFIQVTAMTSQKGDRRVLTIKAEGELSIDLGPKER
jgi:hypothetical protein